MRLLEFAPDMVEDEAEVRGDSNLITTLELLRQQSAGKHLIPRIKAASLIQLINRQSDSTPFTLQGLMDAYKTNDVVKNLVSDIKDDEAGQKYVYLTSPDGATDSSETGDAASTGEPGKIVSKMASKAAASRS